MFSKISTIGCFSFGVLGVLIAIGSFFFLARIQEKKLVLETQIAEYQEKELKLNNMQKTVQVLYNLTPYEARYYSFIFYDFSEKYKLPWEVYPALVKIESCFKSGVMSKQKAKGMTQVLECTGKNQAGKLGIPFDESTLWNCVLNMVIGFNFFSEGYVESISSNSQEIALKHAMKRYCGGPGYSLINDSAKIYVSNYKTDLWDEYLKVSYVYKGICYDQYTAAKRKEIKKEPRGFLGPFSKFKALLKVKLS